MKLNDKYNDAAMQAKSILARRSNVKAILLRHIATFS
jgi:hypothetical protein